MHGGFRHPRCLPSAAKALSRERLTVPHFATRPRTGPEEAQAADHSALGTKRDRPQKAAVDKDNQVPF